MKKHMLLVDDDGVVQNRIVVNSDKMPDAPDGMRFEPVSMESQFSQKEYPQFVTRAELVAGLKATNRLAAFKTFLQTEDLLDEVMALDKIDLRSALMKRFYTAEGVPANAWKVLRRKGAEKMREVKK